MRFHHPCQHECTGHVFLARVALPLRSAQAAFRVGAPDQSVPVDEEWLRDVVAVRDDSRHILPQTVKDFASVKQPE